MKRFDMAHHRRFDMTHYKTPARRQAAGHNLRKHKTVGQNRRRVGVCPHDGPMRLTMKSRLRADARISPAMRVSGLKLLVAFLIVGMNWVGLAAVGTTLAYYNDNEGSSENALSAGSLDFSLDPDEWTPVGKEDALLPGDTVSRAVSIFDNGTIGFQYTASLTKTAGDDAFCNALELEARDLFLGKIVAAATFFLSILIFIAFAAIISVN